MSYLFSITPKLTTRIIPSTSTLSKAIRRPTHPASKPQSIICARCRRSFSANAALSSGHNKWSKIKHEKAATDKKKTAQRSHFAKALTLYSKMFGADPVMNTSLANTIAIAKKAGMPKANIDLAIARGQGKSATGASLESLTIEAMFAPSVAMILDIETDNKNRSLFELRTLLKKHGATVAPTAFLFTRRGQVVLGPSTSTNDDNFGSNKASETEVKGTEIDEDDLMMQALDAGAEDVEQDDEGNVILWTQPSMTQSVARDLAQSLGMEVLSSEIVWVCTSDKVRVDDTKVAANLAKLFSLLSEDSGVQAIYTNAERGDVSEEEWGAVEEALEGS
ncbi:duf28 domain-containing protein [Astrocystis sublimbata]|nr:duf28 domain-containing protein [Astrocystis sublimbata]